MFPSFADGWFWFDGSLDITFFIKKDSLFIKKDYCVKKTRSRIIKPERSRILVLQDSCKVLVRSRKINVV